MAGQAHPCSSNRGRGQRNAARPCPPPPALQLFEQLLRKARSIDLYALTEAIWAAGRLEYPLSEPDLQASARLLPGQLQPVGTAGWGAGGGPGLGVAKRQAQASMHAPAGCPLPIPPPVH